MHRRADLPLLERERELELVRRAVASAGEGVGGGLIVEGPPGIGKSSLLGAASAEATPNTLVLQARGSELETDVAYGVVRQLLERPLAGAEPATRDTLLAGAAHFAEAVLLDPAAREADGADATAVTHGLYWLLVNLAASRPVLLVVDDAHWADLASIRWLVYLAQRLDGLRVTLLVGTRPADRPGHAELLEHLAASPSVDLLQPSALSRASVELLTCRALGDDVEDDFVEACVEVTGGNPFLAGELLDELAYGHVAPTAANASVVRRQTAQSVSRAALGRLRRLSDAARSLAHAVVVLGDGTDLPVAARVAELEVPAALEAAGDLAAAFILRDARPLSFVHPLVRASVYAQLSPADLDRWHARAVEELTALNADPGRIALHVLACEPRGDAAAVEVLRDAARDALRRTDSDVAARYLERAEREPPPAHLRSTVQHERGLAELRAGRLTAAADLLVDVLPDLDVPTEGATLAALSGALVFTGRGDEAVDRITDLLSRLPDDQRELGLRLQAARSAAGYASPAAWKTGERLRFEPAERPPTTLGERMALGEQAWRAVHHEPASVARGLALRALEGDWLSDGLLPSVHGFWLIPIALLFAGDATRAIQVTAEARAWARREGSTFATIQSANVASIAWEARGVLTEAEADAQLNATAASLVARNAWMIIAQVRVAQGRASEAADIWHAQALEPAPDDRSRGTLTLVATRAEILAGQGRWAEALEQWQRCAVLEEQWDIRTPVLTNWQAGVAAALGALGRTDEARAQATLALGRARAFGTARRLGEALRVAASLEEREAALPMLLEATTMLAGSEAPLEHARALFALGGTLRRSGLRADAREPLTDAIELARRCGAHGLADDAHEELVAAGARPRRDPIASRSELTASELRVARLAADGLTNREIAQSLFLTEKTIELHLTSSYRKLDIRGRTQLPAALPPAPAEAPAAV